MILQNPLFSLQIRNGARDTQDPVKGPRRQIHPPENLFHKLLLTSSQCAVLFRLGRIHLTVKKNRLFTKSIRLTFLRRNDTPADILTLLLRFSAEQLSHRNSGRIRTQINSIQNRSRNPVLIILNLRLCAMTSILRIETAGTRIRCTDQHKLRRKFIRSAVSCNDNSLVLQRLAKKVQALPSEFRELIQKQYSPVRKRYGSGSRIISSSDQCLLRNGVVRSHKGPLSDERTPSGSSPAML